MLIPEPKGNYIYIEKIEFATKSDGSLFLIFKKDGFEKLDERTHKTLKNMFEINHKEIYEHYRFDDSLKLLIVPTFDKRDGLEIMDLGRKPKKVAPQIARKERGVLMTKESISHNS